MHPESDDPGDFDRAAQAPVRLVPEGDDPASHEPVAWDSLRRHGRRTIVRFADIDTRDAIAARTHWQLWVDPRDLPPLESPDTWWANDLVGCTVSQVGAEATDDTVIGEVTGIASGPVHDFLQVRRPGGASVEIPLIKAFLREVAVERRQIRVDLPDGLVEG